MLVLKLAEDFCSDVDALPCLRSPSPTCCHRDETNPSSIWASAGQPLSARAPTQTRNKFPILSLSLSLLAVCILVCSAMLILHFGALVTAQWGYCGLVVASLRFNCLIFVTTVPCEVSMSQGDPDMRHNGLTFGGILFVTTNYLKDLSVPFFWMTALSSRTVIMRSVVGNTTLAGAAIAQSVLWLYCCVNLGRDNSVFFTASRISFGPTQHRIEWIPGFPPGLNLPRREVCVPFLSSAQRNMPSSAPQYVLM
jgi:hypothetical protein